MVWVLVVRPLLPVVVVLFWRRVPHIIVVLAAMQICIAVHILLLANVRLIVRDTMKVIIVIVDRIVEIVGRLLGQWSVFLNWW